MSLFFCSLFASWLSAMPSLDAVLKDVLFDLLSFTVIGALISVYDRYTLSSWKNQNIAAAGSRVTVTVHEQQRERFSDIGNGGISVNTWLF